MIFNSDWKYAFGQENEQKQIICQLVIRERGWGGAGIHWRLFLLNLIYSGQLSPSNQIWSLSTSRIRRRKNSRWSIDSRSVKLDLVNIWSALLQFYWHKCSRSIPGVNSWMCIDKFSFSRTPWSCSFSSALLSGYCCSMTIHLDAVRLFLF